MKKILLPILGACALILGACANPGPDPVPPGTTYEVIFKNYDGTTLYTTEVEHGANAVYEGETPTQPSDDARIKHDWTGWDKTLYEIKEDKTITATYSTSYLMRFYSTAISEDFDPEVDVAPTLEEEDLLYEGWLLSTDTLRNIDEVIPELKHLMLPVNDAYGYEWDSFAYLDEDNEVTTPTNSQTIKRISYQDFYSIYDDRKEVQLNDVVYVVNFYNADENNTLLYVDGLREGETHAAYAGETPTLPDNVEENISYTFEGWRLEDDETETVIDLATYTIESDTNLVAKYKTDKIGGGDTPVTYTVTFANWDDEVLFVDTVLEGETAVYEGETPTRPDDSENTYTFNGWDRDITNVQESFTTKATYVSSPIDVPPTPDQTYTLVVDTSTYPFTLNENNETPNCEEYMITTGVSLNVDDTFTIRDDLTNQTVLVTSYRDHDATADAGSAYLVGDLTYDEAGTSTVHVAGDYTFYLKFWEDGAIELWSPRVSEPEPPTPSAEGMYIVGQGSFVSEGEDPWTIDSGIKLEANPNAAEYYGFEYMITGLALEEGDQFRFFDVEANNYVSVSAYSAGSAFSVGDLLIPGAEGNETQDNIVVATPGEYDIYIHNYTDNLDWIEVYATPISEPTPTPIVEDGAYVVGTGSFLKDPTLTWDAAGGVKMETNPNPGADIVTEYTITLDFEVGDTWKLVTVTEGTTTWHAWQNGSTPEVFTDGMMHVTEDNDKNIVVDEAGTYTIYLSFYENGSYSTWIQVATPSPVE